MNKFYQNYLPQVLITVTLACSLISVENQMFLYKQISGLAQDYRRCKKQDVQSKLRSGLRHCIYCTCL